MESLQTFRNLKAERQEEIILVCLGEFARNGYENASLSAVIDKLGLAKGSFYRYFANKKSLYLYLLNHVYAKRLQFERGILDGSITDFFEMLKASFTARIKFDTTFPLHAAFMDNALKEKDSEELGNMEVYLKGKILDTIKKLMDKPRYSNSFREDVPKELLAWQIMSVNIGLYEYLDWKNAQPMEGSDDVRKLSEEEIGELAGAVTEILKKGITVI